MSTTATDRTREEIVHELDALYEQRRRIDAEQARSPTPPIRIIGLMVVFASALAWYTGTDIGLTAGIIGFTIGCLLMIVPRGSSLASIFTRDGYLPTEADLVDEQIAALETALKRIDGEAGP